MKWGKSKNTIACMYNILISKITNGEEHFKVSVCLMEYLDGVYFQYFQNHKKMAIYICKFQAKYYVIISGSTGNLYLVK